jgi:predicted nuclease of predicted toxin-antitoxin system
MRILLDECLPRRLLRDLHPYSATTVPREGWAGMKDTELVKLAAAEFDVFITLDSNLIYQQNLRLANNLCIVVLQASSSRYESLSPLAPKLRQAIDSAKPGSVKHVA